MARTGRTTLRADVLEARGGDAPPPVGARVLEARGTPGPAALDLDGCGDRARLGAASRSSSPTTPCTSSAAASSGSTRTCSTTRAPRTRRPRRCSPQLAGAFPTSPRSPGGQPRGRPRRLRRRRRVRVRARSSPRRPRNANGSAEKGYENCTSGGRLRGRPRTGEQTGVARAVSPRAKGPGGKAPDARRRERLDDGRQKARCSSQGK